MRLVRPESLHSWFGTARDRPDGREPGQGPEQASPGYSMMKVITIGLPILYLLGTAAFGTLYLSRGGEDLIEAIAFGTRWPTYIHIFIG